MNINQVRKHYDTLAPNERIAAIVAAAMRGDEQEAQALRESAPQKIYKVGDHYFMSWAFDHLAAVHMCQCLNLGACLLMGYFLLVGDSEPDQEKEERIYGNLETLARTLKATQAAWERFCRDQGQDPEWLVLNLPGSEATTPDNPGGPGILPVIMRIAQELSPGDPDPEDVEEIISGLVVAFHRLT